MNTIRFLSSRGTKSLPLFSKTSYIVSWKFEGDAAEKLTLFKAFLFSSIKTVDVLEVPDSPKINTEL